MKEFKVKIGMFEGPLDLLLNLIEERKLHINDVSLAAVTDEYINYVKSLSELPVAQTANFILVASTLLLIKSKSLLPVLDLTPEEQGSIDDLERRLKLHKLFKDLSRVVKEQFGLVALFPKTPSKEVEPIFSPDKTMTLPALGQSIRAVLAALPQKTFLPKAAVEKIMTLEQMIDRLSTRISSALKTSFRDFAGIGKAKKVEVILSFLAILELVKRGAISVTQNEHFEDIAIESGEGGVPKYH